MNQTTERPWSDLPEELLSTIANFLTSNPNLLNTLTFRSVCNSWRNSCPPFSHPSILSPLLPLSVNRFRPPFYLPYSTLDSKITVTVIYTLHRPNVLSSIPHTWVLFVDEFEPGKVKIRLPFSKGSYNMNSFFPDFVNLFDFDVHEIGRFYNLSYSYFYNDRLCVKLEKPRFCSEDVVKVVLFGDGSAAVALFQGGKLGLCRLGVGVFKEGQWEVIHCGKGFRFDDIVEYKGGVLGVDRRGRVYEVGYSTSEIKPVVRSVARGDGRRNRLVESLGRLYLVVRCDVGSETNGVTFKVYELNERRRKWVEVSGIGDRVFFFGVEFSLSVSAQELFFRKNCILFKQHSFQSYKGEVDDDAMFSNSGRNVLDIVVCHLDDASHAGAIECERGYSDTLWPPPAWIWPITRLERLRIIDAAAEDLITRIPENIETKFQDLIIATEASGGSCDDWKPLCSEIQRFAHDFKESVNQGMVNEQDLMNCEKKLQVSLNNFHHMQSSPVHAQTEGLRIEKRKDCDLEPQVSIQHTYFDAVNLSWDIWYLWGRLNASTFGYEDYFRDFSELVCRFYSFLNC
ncbi:hypothetical protein KSS87_015363 [Heliosperma pusillum]|nr:hypothetical protein KSS87_015363 [Heliosperma pusillum]